MPYKRLPLSACAAGLRRTLLAGVATILLPVSVQAAEGRFSPAVSWPFIPIHAALLPDGKVATFGTTPEGEHGGYIYDIWDPARGTDAAAHLTLPNGTSANTFCAGQVLLPYNGQVMVTGGNTPQESSQIDYDTQRLTSLTPTTYQRWYATLTTLPDGRVMVNGGIPPYGTWQDSSTVAEIFTPGAGWKTLPGSAVATSKIGGEENRYRYPRVFPVAGNKVFALSGKAMYTVSYAGQGATSAFTPFNKPNIGSSSSATMYRPGLVLQVGGGAGENDVDGPAGSTGATVIDIRGATPAVRDTAPMRFGRHWPTTTVLPTGEVLVTGGSSTNNGYGYTPAAAALTAEIWSPDSGTWRSDATMANPRLYHSVALLLPSGQVYVGGGGSPGPMNLKDGEIYTPGYLLDDKGNALPRPTITAAPGKVALGKSFRIETDKPVARVTLVKTGAVTHGFNMDQRFFELAFKADAKGADATMPADAINATPGFYMVFAFDAAGVPSPARIVKLPSPIGDDGRGAPQPATPGQPTIPTTPTNPTTPTAATDLPPQQPSPLALAGSQTCLAPAGMANASRIGTSGTCGASPWSFRSLGSDRYVVSSGSACLDTGASGAAGSPAEMWSCDNSKEQIWRLAAGRTAGTRMIVSEKTGLCLASGSGATLRQEACAPSSATQSWQVPGSASPATPTAPTTPTVPVPAPTTSAFPPSQPAVLAFSAMTATSCLQAKDGKAGNGIAAAVGACSTAPQLSLRSVGANRYVVASGNRCLDVGAVAAAGSAAEFWSCDNSEEQVWTLTAGASGTKLRAARNGLCLDANDGTTARQYACDAKRPAQDWGVYAPKAASN